MTWGGEGGKVKPLQTDNSPGCSLPSRVTPQRPPRPSAAEAAAVRRGGRPPPTRPRPPHPAGVPPQAPAPPRVASSRRSALTLMVEQPPYPGEEDPHPQPGQRRGLRRLPQRRSPQRLSLPLGRVQGPAQRPKSGLGPRRLRSPSDIAAPPASAPGRGGGRATRPP